MTQPTTCPNCGAQLRLIRADGITTTETPGLVGRLFRRDRGGHTYHHTVDTSWPSQAADRDRPRSAPAHLEPGESRKVTRYRTRDLVADVITPAFWAVIGGSGIGLTAIPVSVWLRLEWWWPVTIWLGSTTVLFFVSGRNTLHDWSLVSHTEELQRAEPPPAPMLQRTSRTIRAEVTDEHGQRRQFADLPDTYAFWQFSRAVAIDGQSFSEATAKACGILIDVESWAEPDQMGFRQVRDLFIARGWAAWRNPEYRNQGVILRLAGKNILRQIADSPPPQEDIDA